MMVTRLVVVMAILWWVDGEKAGEAAAGVDGDIAGGGGGHLLMG